jgi:DNA-nicking Smr family endonuclease
LTEIHYPINGILDLHTFHPKDIRDLIPEYLSECKLRNINQIRIIHGKGTGTLRRTVHAILDKHPDVIRYWHEGASAGSWGATIVSLKL